MSYNNTSQENKVVEPIGIDEAIEEDLREY